MAAQYFDGKVPEEVQLAHEIEVLQRDLAQMKDVLELKRYLLEYLTRTLPAHGLPGLPTACGVQRRS